MDVSDDSPAAKTKSAATASADQDEDDDNDGDFSPPAYIATTRRGDPPARSETEKARFDSARKQHYKMQEGKMNIKALLQKSKASLSSADELEEDDD